MTLSASMHKNLLIQILRDIYSDTSIAPFLGFKGGTAAYLFYDLDRFSVDLDFDLLDDSKEELIFARIEEIAKNYGRLKEVRKKRFNLFFLLSYDDKSQNIKIEINRRSFGSKYDLKNYLGIPMLVMKKEDMVAHKLMAMYERMGKTNRDIYDVCFFMKHNFDINRSIVEERSKVPYRNFIKKCINLLEKINTRNILQGMGELLDAKQKTRAKEHLIKDVIFLLKLELE